MDWAHILAYVTGTVDQELLARNEYLVAENRILKVQLNGRLNLSDAERGVLGEIGHRLGRKVDIATIARPDTILGWYRKLVARKFDGSARRGPGRPRIRREVELLIIRMASENRDWGYDRIAGALANLGHEISDQMVGNVLRRHGLPPAPERKRTTTWATFVRTHVALLAGTDFFTAESLVGQSQVSEAALTAKKGSQVHRAFPRSMRARLGTGAAGPGATPRSAMTWWVYWWVGQAPQSKKALFT
jgi:putative transposase